MHVVNDLKIEQKRPSEGYFFLMLPDWYDVDGDGGCKGLGTCIKFNTLGFHCIQRRKYLFADYTDVQFDGKKEVEINCSSISNEDITHPSTME